MNWKAFYDILSGTPQFPAMTTKQVQGIATIVDVWAQWYQERYPLEYLAAVLTQIHHETGGRMLPVMETYASTPASAAQRLEKAYVAGNLPWVDKRYWLADKNGLIWIGRGDLQITHKANYSKARKAILEAFDLDIPLDENPELALDPVISAVIAFEGMTKGLFTGDKLDDFYKKDDMDYVGQRDIVNGDGKDKEIQHKMKSGGALFEKALKAGGTISFSVERFLPGMDKTIAPGERPEPVVVVNKAEERVKVLQRRLTAHGYGEIVGAIDGKYGPKTAKAVDVFESSRNIKLDHVDAATWEALQKPAAGEKPQ